tara:strand:- start:137 stop:685 length:549 start_codon:yes stop_codon:yes gene_type:complete
MKKKLLLFSLVLVILFGFFKLFLNNDVMKPIDFKDTEPELQIEKYFEGGAYAYGILQDRKGKVIRQFRANMFGEYENNILTLKENFYWNDGEIQNRIWKIKKVDDHNYIGTAEDVVGEAKGVSYGSAFKFEYYLIVPFKGKNIKIRFDDWIFKQSDKIAINRATLSKFGFKVGELTVVFQKH